RRRHTRSKRDWSSDVCSSDLNLGRLYFFHGEETFLLHHYLAQMKKQLLDPLTESFNFHRLDNETFDIRSFADAVENLPMMAEHKIGRASCRERGAREVGEAVL